MVLRIMVGRPLVEKSMTFPSADAALLAELQSACRPAGGVSWAAVIRTVALARRRVVADDLAPAVRSSRSVAV